MTFHCLSLKKIFTFRAVRLIWFALSQAGFTAGDFFSKSLYGITAFVFALFLGLFWSEWGRIPVFW